MRILILVASNRQPVWVYKAYQEYAKRFKAGCVLEFQEIPLAKRGGVTQNRKPFEKEGQRMLRAVPDGAHVVALEQGGRPWSTHELKGRLEVWMQLGQPLCFLVGGPEGLPEACLERAKERWSLSNLTLPHGLARVVLAEALYRAWSILQHHPYHRS